MEKMKISVVILTYNEEKNIEKCLKSVFWADELIIIDSLSTDQTINICKKYTNKIYQNVFQGYAAQRNYALSKISNEWVLFIDADEMLSENVEATIRKAVDNDRYNGYYFPRRNNVFGKWVRFGGNYPDYQLRLFRREDAQYEQEIHEKLNIKGDRGYLDTDLFHYPYKDLYTYFEDFNRYTTLEVKELVKKNKKLNWVKLFILPCTRFGYTYFIKLGFLDGWQGFLMSFFGAVYMFVKYAKYREFMETKINIDCKKTRISRDTSTENKF